MKYFLIINPKSRNERSRALISMILREFGERSMEFDHVFVTSYAAIRAEAEYANRKGYDAIVAVGGDGTINAVINGFYDAGGNRISHACFGVLYTGTSPDFCKSYGIPLEPSGAIAALAAHRIRRIRTGRITFQNTTDPLTSETRIFACCANIGLGAGVAAQSNKIRKYTGDFAGTFIAILWNIARQGSRKLLVSMDGTVRELPRALNVSAGRTRYIASGVRVTEGMGDDDDRFYLLAAQNISWNVLPRLLRQVYTGKLNSPEILEFTYARNVTIESPDVATGVEFDGDAAGFLPCTIELAPEPLDLIVDGP